MDRDVHPRFACQLETRTWYITDNNGKVETVNGPGVVGGYHFHNGHVSGVSVVGHTVTGLL